MCEKMSLILVPFLGGLFPLCFALTNSCDGFIVVVCRVWLLSLGSLFFSNESQRGSGSGWERRQRGIGRSKGGAVIRKNCMRKSIYFQ